MVFPLDGITIGFPFRQGEGLQSHPLDKRPVFGYNLPDLVDLS